MSSISIQSKRLKNLFQFEWTMYSRFYTLGSIGLLVMIFSLFFIVWFQAADNLVWKRGSFSFIFFAGFVFISIFGIGQSFFDLRSHSRACRYLSLPATTFEKLLTQFIARLFLPLLLYPIVFWLGANLSIDFYFFLQNKVFGNEITPEIEKVELLYLYWWVPSGQIGTVYWGLFGAILLFPSLMFLGGIVFGKWNSFWMPFTMAIFWMLISACFVAVSFLTNPSRWMFSGEVRFDLSIDQPEVFKGVPLFVFLIVILIWMAIFLSYLVAFLKLKEREV